MRGEKVPDGDHLAMRRRILQLLPEIAAAREHFAVAHDHRAERIIAKRRLFQRDAHEALVDLGRGRFDPSTECGRDDRQRHRAERARDQMAAAHAGGRCFQGWLHARAPMHARANPASLGRRNVMRFGDGPLLQSRPSLTVQ